MNANGASSSILSLSCPYPDPIASNQIIKIINNVRVCENLLQSVVAYASCESTALSTRIQILPPPPPPYSSGMENNMLLQSRAHIVRSRRAQHSLHASIHANSHSHCTTIFSWLSTTYDECRIFSNLSVF